MKVVVSVVFFWFLLSVNGYANSTQSLPKWEFGLGPSLFSFPDYPGSSERNNLILPFPYIVYRSETLTIDQREIKKPIFNYQNLEVDFSLSGSVPVSSKDNKAREGMDDLDGSIEIGPVMRVTLHSNKLNEFKFEWPVRLVLASDFRSIHQEGFTSSPGVFYYFRQSFSKNRRLKISVGAAADYGTAQNNDYFFGIDPNEVTATRPAFKATGGFQGFAYTVGFNLHLNDFWVGAFYRQRDLAQSVFRESSLVEQSLSESYGIVLTWNFFRSEETVQMLE